MDPEAPQASCRELRPRPRVDPDRVAPDGGRLVPLVALFEGGDTVENVPVEFRQRFGEEGLIHACSIGTGPQRGYSPQVRPGVADRVSRDTCRGPTQAEPDQREG